jgi:hypothetical protein
MNFRRAERLLTRFRNASEEEQRRIINAMTPRDLAALDAWFEFWAHENQLPPDGEGWRTWLMLAGRGFGKTRAGAEWVHGLAMAKAGARIALIGATIQEARSIMVEGVSGLLAVARNHGQRPQWEPSLGRLTWPNGSEAQVFSGDSADGLRGPEHDFAWCAAESRLAGRGRGRGAFAGCASRCAATRRLLYRRLGRVRGLGRQIELRCRVDRGRLAVHRAG